MQGGAVEDIRVGFDPFFGGGVFVEVCDLIEFQDVDDAPESGDSACDRGAFGVAVESDLGDFPEERDREDTSGIRGDIGPFDEFELGEFPDKRLRGVQGCSGGDRRVGFGFRSDSFPSVGKGVCRIAPVGTFFDPSLDGFDFFGVWLSGVFGGHLRFIETEDTSEDEGLGGFAGDECWTGVSAGDHGGQGEQFEVRLGSVVAMASDAVFGQDGLDPIGIGVWIWGWQSLGGYRISRWILGVGFVGEDQGQEGQEQAEGYRLRNPRWVHGWGGSSRHRFSGLRWVGDCLLSIGTILTEDGCHIRPLDAILSGFGPHYFVTPSFGIGDFARCHDL